MKHLMRIGLVLALALGAYGCGDDEETTTDAGTKVDAGTKDSGVNCPTEMCNGICCPTQTFCNTTTNMCDPVGSCSCGSAVCGIDSCGNNVCGTCPTGQVCTAGACVPNTCTPACAGKACGASDGCGGKCNGTCAANQYCDTSTYTCKTGTCTPVCAGLACGAADGCGGKCIGSCPGGQTCNAATYTCQTAGSCDPSTCAQGQGCYDPATGSTAGTTVCTCLPATQTRTDTCAQYGLACGMDPDAPAAATCRKPQQWEDCVPNTAGACDTGFTCIPLQNGGGICTKVCANGSPDCDDIMTACFSDATLGNFCWYNICADPSDPPTGGNAATERANYFQACETGDTVPGTCIPLNMDNTAGVCEDLGVCLQSGSAASGGTCDADADRTNMAGLCGVNELCFGYNDGTAKCLGLCNSGPTPQPVATCNGGLTCYDASGVTDPNDCPQARLGACDVTE